jgi:hypothetical protein
MTRLLLIAALLLPLPNATVPGISSLRKESGWISTCGGIGCYEYRFDCATYTSRDPQGDLNRYYCYQN